MTYKKDTALNDIYIITEYNYFVNEQVISIKSAVITCTCEAISFITLSAYTSIWAFGIMTISIVVTFMIAIAFIYVCKISNIST